MNIRDQLLELGMKEEELGTYQSDLHVLKNDISTAWLETYQFKMNVRPFVSQIDHKIWYDVMFGYMNEHRANRTVAFRRGENENHEG